MNDGFTVQQTQDEVTIVGILLFLGTLFFWKLIQITKNHTRNSLLRKAGSIKRIKKMSWESFEQLCKVLFEKQGWRVLGNEKKGADGGVDLWMKRRMRSAIVQCKRYDEAMVTIKVIREMYGLMHEYGVDEVYVVTSSHFTKECYRFVKDKPITLIDEDNLLALVRKYR